MVVNGTAYDLIVVRGGDDGIGNDDTANSVSTIVTCSDCLVRFGSLSHDTNASTNHKLYLLLVDDQSGDARRFPIVHNTIQSEETHISSEKEENLKQQQQQQRHPDSTALRAPEHDPFALQSLAALLQPGQNKARYILIQKNSTNNSNNSSNSDENGKEHSALAALDVDEVILGMAPFYIYVWNVSDKIAVVDVDGTITKSTLTGFWQTAVRRDYSTNSCHDGICQFVSSLLASTSSTNGQSVVCVYLTNRPITYVEATREFLQELRQDDCRLPHGPLIGFTGNLAGVFKMDFYDANAHTFKYDTLQTYVARPFQQQHPGQSAAHGDGNANNGGLFYAGFGNTLYDMHAYHHAGIPLHRTFLIDKQSRIYCLDKDGTANGETTAPPIDNPKEYTQFKGTLFANGYRDDALLPHIRKEA